VGRPEAVSWGSNRIDVFAVGVDGALWHKWWDGQRWGGFESLGGRVEGTPSAISWGPGFKKRSDVGRLQLGITPKRVFRLGVAYINTHATTGNPASQRWRGIVQNHQIQPVFAKEMRQIRV
jgi:hypothetical protein